jgi:hypothetical protein
MTMMSRENQRRVEVGVYFGGSLRTSRGVLGRGPLLHKQGRECTKQVMQECRQRRLGSLEISTLSSFTSEKKDIRLNFLQGLDPTARKRASLEPDSF